MATLISNSTGNFTTAATWSLVDTTSLSDSEAAQTATTTAFVSSQAFTPGAITIDAIAVKIQTRSGAPSGTFSVRLAVAGVAVVGTTVTINVTDIPAVNGSNNNGWLQMKLAAPVLLLAATSYTVQIQSSVNAQVTCYRTATAADWSRVLRTTTTQAPAAADTLYVAGDYTGAGTNNTYTITNNNTTTTSFGQIQVSTKGVLASGIAASTNYYLKIAGNLSIYTDGTYTQGTAASPVPSTSTSKLEFDNASNVQFGVEVRIGGTFKTGGAVITNSAVLAADAAAAATSLTTNVSTGWKSGDVIALASTTRTRAESESKALTANAVGTALTITALTNAHSGTSPTAAELINLTRNVQIFGTSAANQAYVNIVSTSVVDIQSTEFFNMGSGTVLKRGIDVATTTGSCTINNSSMHDFTVATSIGVNISGGASNNYTVSNCVMYNIANSGLIQVATTGTAYTLNNIIIMLTTATAFSIGDLTGTITNLSGISATGAGITLADNAALTTEVFGTLNNFVAHSNSTLGVSLVNITGVTNNPMGTFSNINVWRNTTNGLNISNCFTIIVDTVTAFGNGTSNLTIGGTECDNIYIKSVTANAGTTLTCPIGINITSDCHEVYVDSSSFGATTTHATADINVSGVNFFPRLTTRNTTLSSPTNVGTPSSMTEGGFVSLAKLNTTAGNHKTFKKYGTIIPDTVIFNSNGTSTRLTPNNAAATNKLQGTVRKLAVNSGQTATITVFLRKSVAGDGTAYNGNQPRLMLKADAAAGVLTDTVLATADNTYNGTFKALVATTPAITDNAAFQIYVDCDGTTGWINVDDWAVQ